MLIEPNNLTQAGEPLTDDNAPALTQAIVTATVVAQFIMTLDRDKDMDIPNSISHDVKLWW
jgi:hypothetical protein